MNQPQTGRNIGAVILIAIGALLFVTQVLGISIWGIFGMAWPMFIVLPGLLFLGLAFFGDRKMAAFAIPGSIITGTGLLLWVQSTTGRWESWAYAWSLYPVFVGLGLTFLGIRTDKPSEVKTGRGLVMWGTVAFLVLFAFFELFIFGGLSGLGTMLIPLVLIGAGVLLLTGGRVPGLERDKAKRKNELPVFTGPRVLKNSSNGASALVNHDLQRKIDEALAEDDPNTPSTGA